MTTPEPTPPVENPLTSGFTPNQQPPAAPLITPDKPVEKKKPGFFTYFFRWSVLIIALLVAGAAAVWFGLLVPERDANTAAQAQIQELNDTLSTTQAELETTQAQAADLQSQLDAMTTERDTVLVVTAALNMQVDVQEALVAIAKGDTGSAQIIMVNIQNDLSVLEPLLPDPALADVLSARLESARTNLTEDNGMTEGDLEILNNNLSDLIEGLTR
jgi:multidrug efflux pump subunit AcrA (membrane-fusion protein)